jgi:hypothetical protein
VHVKRYYDLKIKSRNKHIQQQNKRTKFNIEKNTLTETQYTHITCIHTVAHINLHTYTEKKMYTCL